MYGEGFKYYSKVCRDGREEGEIACDKCEHRDTCSHKMPVIGGDASQAWQLSTWSPSVWVHGFNGVVGLDFVQIRQIAEILDIPMTENLMRRLKVIEQERLKAIDEMRDKTDG